MSMHLIDYCNVFSAHLIVLMVSCCNKSSSARQSVAAHRLTFYISYHRRRKRWGGGQGAGGGGRGRGGGGGAGPQ